MQGNENNNTPGSPQLSDDQASVSGAELVLEGQAKQIKKKRDSRKQNVPGRKTMTAKEKKEKEKEATKVRRKEYILSLIRSGEIGSAEGRRRAKLAGIEIEPHEIGEGKYRGQEIVAPTPEECDIDPDREYKRRLSYLKEQGGRGISLLSGKEMKTFLDYIKLGMGRYAACQTIGITYEKFHNTFRHDEVFCNEVKTAEKACLGLLEMRIYDAALNGDLGACRDFIRIKTNRQAMIFGQKITKSEHNLKRRAVEAQLGMMNQNNRPSFACLSDKELEDYNKITEMIGQGVQPSQDDLVRLGQYSARLIQANSPAPPNRDFVGEVVADVHKPIDVSFTQEK